MRCAICDRDLTPNDVYRSETINSSIARELLLPRDWRLRPAVRCIGDDAYALEFCRDCALELELREDVTGTH